MGRLLLPPLLFLLFALLVPLLSLSRLLSLRSGTCICTPDGMFKF